MPYVTQTFHTFWNNLSEFVWTIKSFSQFKNYILIIFFSYLVIQSLVHYNSKVKNAICNYLGLYDEHSV